MDGQGVQLALQWQARHHLRRGQRSTPTNQMRVKQQTEARPHHSRMGKLQPPLKAW